MTLEKSRFRRTHFTDHGALRNRMALRWETRLDRMRVTVDGEVRFEKEGD